MNTVFTLEVESECPLKRRLAWLLSGMASGVSMELKSVTTAWGPLTVRWVITSPVRCWESVTRRRSARSVSATTEGAAKFTTDAVLEGAKVTAGPEATDHWKERGSPPGLELADPSNRTVSPGLTVEVANGAITAWGAPEPALTAKVSFHEVKEPTSCAAWSETKRCQAPAVDWPTPSGMA